MPVYYSVLNVKALVGAFNQENPLRNCEIFANLRLKLLVRGERPGVGGGDEWSLLMRTALPPS